jgi:uncharacterized protein YbcC (UPF0753/DUF2309 family)
MVVEHYPEVVLQTIQQSSETYEWFKNDWVNLVVVHPVSRKLFRFKDGHLLPYKTSTEVKRVTDLTNVLETNTDNIDALIYS